MALMLAKKKRPFTDGEEIIKPALAIIENMLGDKQVTNKLDQIALSNNTMTTRVGELTEDIHHQVTNHIAKSTCFSLAMDESCDISDTAQVAIFVRSITDEFEIIEELLGLEPIHGTTKGADLFETLKSCVERNNIDWKKLDSICTDGAPAFTGKHSGCLALLEKFLDRPLLNYHCIIHQESLCGKKLNLKHVMDVVLKCVTKIRAKALNRREFREFITNLDDEYGELLLHCEVRWLSRGKVLSRFWDLKAAVFLFLSEIDELRDECQCLVNNEWLCDLAFLVDVTSFLNELNIRLQGKDKLFTNLCDDVSAFKMRLSLMINQLSKGNVVSFPTVASQSVAAALNLTQYKVKLQLLLETFQDRFAEFDAEQDHVALFTNPFVFPDAKICQLETNLQNELINLKCNSAIRAKFMELPVTPTCTDYVRFRQLLPLEKFRHLRYFSQRYLCRFGSTYRCEQAFSAMKLIKNKQRPRLTDVNLGALMTLATTNLKPDIEKLASK